jgi:hypothetical protein
VGRYPGDSYAGGNPWQLLCAVFSEVLYLASAANFNRIEARGVDELLTVEEYGPWMDLLHLNEKDLPRGAIHRNQTLVLERIFEGSKIPKCRNSVPLIHITSFKDPRSRVSQNQ